jgi:hypothetical protein
MSIAVLGISLTQLTIAEAELMTEPLAIHGERVGV